MAPANLTLAVGLLIIAGAVWAIVRRFDVRLVLPLAAMALGIVAGDPVAILLKFFTTFTSEQYVVPICTAMGFAYVLRHTGCDQHLVHLLTEPLRRVRALLIPGAVLVGFIVNIPIISQTSTAVAIGAVLIPLLLAARVSRVTAGAALLLGASVGGELINPGAPEFRTIMKTADTLGIDNLTTARCVQATLPLNLLCLAVSTSVFWALSMRAEKTADKDRALADRLEPEVPTAFRVNLFKAMVPLVPLVLLFLVAPPLNLIPVPQEWLISAKEPGLLLKKAGEQLNDPAFRQAASNPFDSRLIGAAMLAGVVVAAFTDRKAFPGIAAAFFEGAGYAFANVTSIIVAATCFGEGVRLIGLDRVVAQIVLAMPAILLPAAGFMSVALGAISGSGMATTQSLIGFFAQPAQTLGIPLEHVGAMVSLGAAAGRTMSPVAAVTLMSANLTETSAPDLVRRVAPPLLAGITAAVILAVIMAARMR